jgi:hypothetical protein
MMIAALIGYAIVIVAGKALGNLSFLISTVTVLASAIGAFKISSGLEYSGASKSIYVICMFIPLIGFIYIVVLLIRANKALA